MEDALEQHVRACHDKYQQAKGKACDDGIEYISLEHYAQKADMVDDQEAEGQANHGQ